MSLPGKACAAIVFLAVLPAPAQAVFSGVSSPSSQLSQTVRAAGFIFSGTVLSVVRDPAQSGHASTVRTAFKVDRGVRGVRTGEVFTIRQWAGVVPAPYRPGQRVFLFLYPRSKLGLTSAVGGDAGRFLIDDGGNVVTAPALTRPVTRPALPAIKSRSVTKQPEFLRQLRKVMEADRGLR